MDTSPKKIHSTHMKRCSKSSVTGEMQVRTTKQYRLTPTKMTMIYKKRKTDRKRDRERGRGRRRRRRRKKKKKEMAAAAVVVVVVVLLARMWRNWNPRLFPAVMENGPATLETQAGSSFKG